MTNQEAVDKLTRAYRVKFEADPDMMGQTIIDLAAPRVAGGEFFTWEEVSGFRKLQMHKESPSGGLQEIDGSADDLADEAEAEIAVREEVAAEKKALSPHTAYARKITKRQAEFCLHHAKGLPMYRAYQLAGYNSSSQRSAEVGASRLLKRPTVAAYFDQLRESTEFQNTMSLAHSKKFLTDMALLPGNEVAESSPFVGVTLNGDGTKTIKGPQPSDKIAAVEKLAKINGWMQEKTEVNVGFNFKLLEGELEEAQVIDGQVVPDMGVTELQIEQQ